MFFPGFSPTSSGSETLGKERNQVNPGSFFESETLYLNFLTRLFLEQRKFAGAIFTNRM